MRHDIIDTGHDILATGSVERGFRPGTMAYNDARTVYGAEAAGPDGCEFLMIRRAWAETHIVG